MTIKILSTIDAQKWDSFVTNPMQSYAWGESRRALGLGLVRFGVYQDEELSDVFHMTLHRMSKFPYRVGYIARSSFPDESVCEYIKQYAKENKIIFVKWEPDIFVENMHETISPLLHVSSQEHFPRFTQYVDLQKTESDVFATFSQTVRRELKLADKIGIVIKSGTDQELYDDFEKLFFLTTKRKSYSGHSQKYHRMVFKYMSEAGMTHLVVAYHEGVPVASMSAFFDREKIYYIYGGSLGSQTPKGAMSQALVELVRFGQTRGLKYLDLWGSLPPTYGKNHSWAGFTRFKQAHGGEFKEYVGSYDLVAYPFLYGLYTIAFKIRKKINAKRN